MAEYSRFFDHIDGDRSYNADDFAEYFRQVLTSGILNGGENLQVYVNGTDRIARIKPGKAWIEGYFYKLTEELELPLDEAHGTYDRIDRIVVRLNTNTEERNIKAYVKTGSPASTPQPPAVTREGDIFEISLAQIKVIHNTTAVPTGNVTDERLDPNVCGLVNSLIQVDTATMQDEFDAFMETLAGQAYVSQEEFDTVTNQLFQSGLNGKTLLEAAIKSKGGTVSKGDEVATFDELNAGIESIITDPSGDATAEASDILLGKTAYSQYKKLTGTMPNRGAPAKTLTTQGGQYNLPSGYYSGGYVKAQFANLIASNIKKGVNVGGVVGTVEEGKYTNLKSLYHVLASGVTKGTKTARFTLKEPTSATIKLIAVSLVLETRSITGVSIRKDGVELKTDSVNVTCPVGGWGSKSITYDFDVGTYIVDFNMTSKTDDDFGDAYVITFGVYTNSPL